MTYKFSSVQYLTIIPVAVIFRIFHMLEIVLGTLYLLQAHSHLRGRFYACLQWWNENSERANGIPKVTQVGNAGSRLLSQVHQHKLMLFSLHHVASPGCCLRVVTNVEMNL